MNYHLSQKMYKIHKMCFDCVINYEAELRRAGLYEAYEKAMIQGSLRAFLVDVEQYILDSINSVDTFVTEQGDIEDWKGNKTKTDKELSEHLKDFLQHARKHLED